MAEENISQEFRLEKLDETRNYLIEEINQKHDKIVLLAKFKLNSIKLIISKALIDSDVSHDEFLLIKKLLREYNEIKVEIKNLKI